MAARCEVELDIFSGMPNPAWILTNDEAEGFLERLAALPRTSPMELSGNLGYRGLVVQVSDVQRIRIQKGTVHIMEGATSVYRRDENRQLERWLLHTGRPHVNQELFQIAERELR